MIGTIISFYILMYYKILSLVLAVMFFASVSTVVMAQSDDTDMSDDTEMTETTDTEDSDMMDDEDVETMEEDTMDDDVTVPAGAPNTGRGGN